MKGASHVDWAISMGIFILYVLGLFIFLKPGVQPVYKGEELIGIVENGLNEDVYFNVKKIPMFIELVDIGPGEYKVNIKFTGNNKFPYCGDNEDFVLVDEDNEYMNFTMTGDDNNCLPNSKTLRFDAYLSNGKNVFWLIYNEETTYDPDNPMNEEEASYGAGEDTIDFTFGVGEEIKGVSFDKLKNLKNVDYNDLKDNWGFPLAREFSFYVVNSSKEDYREEDIIFEYSNLSVPDQTSVFTKEIKDNFLSEKADKSSFIMNIKVF